MATALGQINTTTLLYTAAEVDTLLVSYIKADGTVPLTADWNAGAFQISARNFLSAGTTASVFEDNTDDNSQQTPLVIRRSRSSATAPGAAGFGVALAFSLEGFTNDSFASAGSFSVFWEGAQINDTTSRDSSMRINTMQNAVAVTNLYLNSSGYVAVNSTISPISVLEIRGDGVTQNTDGIRIINPNVSHGMTGVTASNVYGQITWLSAGSGGLVVQGLDDTGTSVPALMLQGTLGSSTPTQSAVEIQGRKKDLLVTQPLSDSELLCVFKNSATAVGTMLGNGALFLGGTSSPSEKLTVAGRIRSTISDIVVEDNARGLILKDTQAPPHYWRIQVTTLGVLFTTDLGTSLPLE
jgi:hypothetical protein